MTLRLIAAAAFLALGIGAAGTAHGLQPGMRTMMQQGGIEHGNDTRRYAPRRRGMKRGGIRSKRMMQRRRR